MPQLIIEQPGVEPITIPLSTGDCRLGRADDNDVVLVADEVSRHHARVVSRNGQTVLVDLKSLNGTYINRQRVVERVLGHMDEVWFGSKCRLVFRDDTRLGRDPMRTPDPEQSALSDDLNRIRQEMESLGNSMSLIVKHGRGEESGEQAADLASTQPDDLIKMGQAYRRLDALYQVSRQIASDFDLDKRLAAVLDTAIEVMDAERGFVLLREADSGNLRVHVAREMGQDLQASSPSMGIAGKAAIDGEPALMTGGQSAGEFAARASIIQQRIASAMAAPLKAEDRIFGSVYLDSRKVGHTFNEEDLELFAALAAQSSMAIEIVRLYEQAVEAEKKRANLGRFLSPAIVDVIMQDDTNLELGGEKRTVTTMFCDVRGFTAISEQTAPTDLVDMLNEHFTALTEVIFQHQGTLDKFMGDEIMAVFGSPLSEDDDPLRAIQAALAIQERNAELNREREREGQPPFHVGTGLCTGEVIAGLVGSPDRMEFTVIGDRVNTAKRLCGVAGPGQTVIDQTTYDAVRNQVRANTLGDFALKGKEAKVLAYEVLGLL
jgi:adenylate cyclase